MATYKLWDVDPVTAGAEPVQVVDRSIQHYDLTATNATTGHYSTRAFTDPGEAVPTGIAQFIYDALKVLQYDGECVLVEDETTFAALPGDVLNLLGTKQPLWQTMNALVYATDINIENGRTSIKVGPAKHLGVDTLIELIRAWRARNRPQQSLTSFATGEAGGSSSEGALGRRMPNDNALDSDNAFKRVSAKDGAQRIVHDATAGKLLMEATAAATSTARIDLRLADCAKAVAPQAALTTDTFPPIKLRKYKVCVNIGGVDKTRTAIFAASDYFQEGTDPA